MVEKELADADTVSDLLGDWYQYWIDFMVELRWIVRTLHTSKPNDGQATSFPEPEPRWVREIEALERLFYCRTATDTACYESRKTRCEERAKEILQELRPLLSTITSRREKAEQSGEPEPPKTPILKP
jgi:hypothetical protein